MSNAILPAVIYWLNMAEPGHDWYLKEWLSALRVKQSELVAKTDHTKSHVSMFVNGKARYNRDAVNEFADILNISPWELLMHPDDAMRLRRLRSVIEDAATDTERTGTGG